MMSFDQLKSGSRKFGIALLAAGTASALGAAALSPVAQAIAPADRVARIAEAPADGTSLFATPVAGDARAAKPALDPNELGKFMKHEMIRVELNNDFNRMMSNYRPPKW